VLRGEKCNMAGKVTVGIKFLSFTNYYMKDFEMSEVCMTHGTDDKYIYIYIYIYTVK